MIRLSGCIIHADTGGVLEEILSKLVGADGQIWEIRPTEQIWIIPIFLRVGPMFVYVLPKISFISRTTPFAIHGRLLKVIEHIIVIGWRVCIQGIVQSLSLQHRSEWTNTVVVLATIKEETVKAQSIRLFASGRHLAPLGDIVRFTDVPTLSIW